MTSIHHLSSTCVVSIVVWCVVDHLTCLDLMSEKAMPNLTMAHQTNNENNTSRWQIMNICHNVALDAEIHDHKSSNDDTSTDHFLLWNQTWSSILTMTCQQTLVTHKRLSTYYTTHPYILQHHRSSYKLGNIILSCSHSNLLVQFCKIEQTHKLGLR